MNRQQAKRFGLLPLLMMASLCAAAGDWNLHALMDSLAAEPHKQAKFREVKEFGLLELPLEQTGELEFRAPDYLRKTVSEPQAQSFEASGNVLVTRNERGHERRFSLSDHPALRAGIDGLRSVLAGDLDSLMRDYQPTLSGARDGWRLALKPRDEELALYVSGVEIEGSSVRLERIEIKESNGDRSTLYIQAPP